MMSIKDRILCVSTTLVAVIALIASGCTFSKDMSGKFPTFPVVAPIDVFKLDAIPEQKLCAISGSKNSREFIDMLSKRYPDGWRKSPHVSLAASYRMKTGATEILILKQGLAISTTKGGNEKSVVVHDLDLNEAEALVRMACEDTVKSK